MLQVFAVSDLVRPDREVEALAAKARELLPPGSMVAVQGTGTVIAKAPASSMSRFSDWLTSERRAAGTTEPKGAAPSPAPPPLGAPQTALRLRYYDVKDLVQPGEASADAFEALLRTVVPHAESLALEGRVVIARASVAELDALGRWLEDLRAFSR